MPGKLRNTDQFRQLGKENQYWLAHLQSQSESLTLNKPHTASKRRNPANDLEKPVIIVVASRYCKPWTLTSVTISTAALPLRPKSFCRPPAKALITAMENEAYSPDFWVNTCDD